MLHTQHIFKTPDSMFSLLYILDTTFHLGLTPASPIALSVKTGNNHGNTKLDPTPGKAHFQMLVTRPWMNPPPINPTRHFEMMGGSWHL